MPGFVIIEKDVLPGNVGEIVLPEQNSLRPNSGTVIRAAVDLEPYYPAGTKVLFGQNAGTTLTIPEGTYTILTEMEIQATVEGA